MVSIILIDLSQTLHFGYFLKKIFINYLFIVILTAFKNLILNGCIGEQAFGGRYLILISECY